MTTVDVASVVGFCRFWFYIYYIVVISVRVCFLCYPMKTEFLLILIFDYCVDVFFFVDFFYLSEKYPASLVLGAGDSSSSSSHSSPPSPAAAGGPRSFFLSSFFSGPPEHEAVTRRRARTSSGGSINVDGNSSVDDAGSISKPRVSNLGDRGNAAVPDPSASVVPDGRRSASESLSESADSVGDSASEEEGGTRRGHPSASAAAPSRGSGRSGRRQHSQQQQQSHARPSFSSTSPGHDAAGGYAGQGQKRAPSKSFTERLSEPEAWFAIFVFIPFELFLFAGNSPFYGYLRMTKLLHTWYFRKYWDGFTASIDRSVPSASGQRAIFFLLMHFLASHFAACIFFVIGYIEATKTPPDRDNMIVWSKLGYYNEDGDFDILHTCSYRYIRYFYFSVNVVETLGFGDIMPRTVSEIIFCIVVYFVGFFLCNLLISNFVVLINGSDAAKTKYLAHIEQLLKFTKLHNLPKSLHNKISAFYEHQMVYLKGIDEKELMEDLPRTLRAKIVDATVRQHLQRVPSLMPLGQVVVNHLADSMKQFVYSPADSLVGVEASARGMFVVTRGLAVLTGLGSDGNILTLNLGPGKRFGERALFVFHTSPYVAHAGPGSLMEALYLSRSSFRYVCRDNMREQQLNKLVEMFGSDGGKTSRPDRSRGDDAEFYVISAGASAAKAGIRTLKPSELLQQAPSVADDAAAIIAHPTSGFRAVWDFLVLFGIGYYIVEVPLMIANMYDPDWVRRFTWDLLVSYAFDIFFMMDLYLRANLFAIDGIGKIVSDPAEIWAKYKSRGWGILFVDVMAVIPFDFIAFGVGSFYLPVLRITKLLRMAYLVTYAKKVERTVRDRTGIQLSFTPHRIVDLLGLLIIIYHFGACLYMFVADFAINTWNFDYNWTMQDEDIYYFSINYGRPYDYSKVYRRALYWALNVMTTCGNGDMPPANITEDVVFSVAMLFGCPFIVSVIGNIASLMSNVGADKRAFESKMAVVRQLLQDKDIPEEIQHKVSFFFDYKFARTGGVDDEVVLSSLSKSLRESVQQHITGAILSDTPCFDYLSSPALNKLVEAVVTRSFLDGDVLTREGEVGTDMFIIESGQVRVSNAAGDVVYATLGPGSHIGESCFIKGAKRNATVTAVGYCDVFMLSRYDFDKVKDNFPDEFEDVLEHIRDDLARKSRENDQTVAKQLDQTQTSASSPLAGNVPSGSGKAISPPPSEDITPPSVSLKQRRLSTASAAGPSSSGKVAPSGDASDVNSELDQSVDMGAVDKPDAVVISQNDFKQAEENFGKQLMTTLVLLATLYNVFLVPLRITLPIPHIVYIADYSFDAILYLDMYLNFTVWPVISAGRMLRDPEEIRKRYVRNHLRTDILARFPFDIFAVFALTTSSEDAWFALTILRIPKVLLMLNADALMTHFESILSRLQIPFFYVRITEIIVGLVTVSHYCGCALLMFATHSRHSDVCDHSEDLQFGSTCEFRGTWLQLLVFQHKLPVIGGSILDKYLRGLNWALPTMTLFVIGDVWPVTVPESTFIVVFLFFGIAVQGFIVGNVMTVATTDENTVILSEKADKFQHFLRDRGAPEELISRVYTYINTMTEPDVQCIATETHFLSEVPYTLKEYYTSQTRLKFLQNCPFFDFCPDAVLRSLCQSMTQRFYGTGDCIIHHGTIGDEMYFIERGEVQIRSADDSVVFATLVPGNFFGETGLVFRSERSANAFALSFCVIYVVRKVDLDRLLDTHEFDATATVKSLTHLQEMNAWRNKAVSHNIEVAKDENSKIARLLRPFDITTNKLKRFIKYFGPATRARVILDFVALFTLSYYAIMVPYNVAFFNESFSGTLTSTFYFQYIIDLLCVFELFVKAFLWYAAAHTQSAYPWDLTSSSLYLDALGLIPLELVVFDPNVPVTFRYLYTFRLIRLLRLFTVKEKTREVEKHLLRFDFKLTRQTSVLIKLVLSYVFTNHWFTCMMFSLHRYVLQHSEFTMFTVSGVSHYDEATGRHTVCDETMLYCYLISLYYVTGLVTSVGFGDIYPCQNVEILLQLIIATFSAIIGASLCGQIGLLQSARDSTNNYSLQVKLRSALHFAKQRNLDKKLSDSIAAHFKHSWHSEMSLGDSKSSMLGLLSTPLASEVALELRWCIMDSVPFFQSASRPVRWQIALALRPEIVPAGTVIYDRYDVADDIYFVDVGCVLVEPDDQSTEAVLATMPYAANLSHMALQYKHMYLPGDNEHKEGSHFGEYCIVSKRAIRMGKAVASKSSELYTLSKKDMGAILSKMPHKLRCKFILNMFCVVGDVQHTEFPELTEADETFNGNFTLAVMNDVSLRLLEAVVRKRAPLDDNGAIVGLEKTTTGTEAGSLNRRRADSMCSLDSDEEEGDQDRRATTTSSQSSPWMMALMQYQRAKDTSTKEGDSVATTSSDRAGRSLTELSRLAAPDDPEAADVISEIEDMVRQMFINVDADGSGQIDREELMEAFEEMGAQVTWEDVDRMIKAADVDGNETVDLEEVTAAVLQEVLKMREGLINKGEGAAAATHEVKVRTARAKTIVVEHRKSIITGGSMPITGRGRASIRVVDSASRHNQDAISSLAPSASHESQEPLSSETSLPKPSQMIANAATVSAHSDDGVHANAGVAHGGPPGPTIIDAMRQSRSYAGVRLASLQNVHNAEGAADSITPER